jgi:hypothetical protein
MTITHGETEGNEVDVQGSATAPRKTPGRRKFCMPPTCTSIINKNCFVTWLICNETEERKCRILEFSLFTDKWLRKNKLLLTFWVAPSVPDFYKLLLVLVIKTNRFYSGWFCDPLIRKSGEFSPKLPRATFFHNFLGLHRKNSLP